MTKLNPDPVTWQQLKNLAAALEDKTDALYDLVKEAREQQENLTWQEIADALGITRQAAWERFTLYRRGEARPTVDPNQGSIC